MQQASRAGKRMRPSRDWFLVLLLIGRESGARIFNQSQSDVRQNQRRTRITFDTQLITALLGYTNVLKDVYFSMKQT